MKVRIWVAELLLLGTESLVVFMLATALAAGAHGEGPSPLTVFLAMLGGFGLVRLLLNFDTSRPTLIGIAVAISALALLVLLNLQYHPAHNPLSMQWLEAVFTRTDWLLRTRLWIVWGVVLVAGAWLRGGALAQRELTYTGALASYTVGLIVVVALLLLAQSSRAAAAINAGALPYFMLGLLMLSFMHLSRGEHHHGNVLRGPWMLTLTGTVAVLAAISALIGLFPIGFLNRILSVVGNAVLLLVSLVVFIIAYPIAYALYWLLQPLFDRFSDWRPPPPQEIDRGEFTQRLREEAERNPTAEWLLLVLKLFFLAAVCALIGYVLWRAYRRLVNPLRSDDEETRVSLAAEGSLGEDLGALFRGLLGRFQRPDVRPREPDLPPDLLAVRRLYLRALEKAAAEGAARPPAATPSEFAPALAAALHTPAAARLSERFAAARYGRKPTSRPELAELERDIR